MVAEENGEPAALSPFHRLRRSINAVSSSFEFQLLKEMLPVILRPRWARRPRAEGQEIVMLVVSALRIDPRVERSARALVEAGFTVRVVGPDISTPRHAEQPLDWGPGIVFDLLPFEAASFVMAPPFIFGHELLRAALRYSPLAFHCHDLNTALIGLKAAFANGVPCVCDFHEWHSENVTWDSVSSRWVPYSKRMSRFLKWAERLVVRRADRTITVNRSIADSLERQALVRHGRVEVVRNIPKLDAVPTRLYKGLKYELRLPEDRFVVLYQGGTGPTRGIEPMIQALAHMPDVTLVIRGPSLDLFGDGYSKLAAEIGVSDRLLLLPPVPSSDVVAAAGGADLGIWSLPPLCKNFTMALPNKIFEYLAAELPVVVANYPEASRIVHDFKVGGTFVPYDPASIAAAIMELRADPERLRRFSDNTRKALIDIDAKTEWRRLAQIHSDLRDRIGKGQPRRVAHGF